MDVSTNSFFSSFNFTWLNCEGYKWGERGGNSLRRWARAQQQTQQSSSLNQWTFFYLFDRPLVAFQGHRLTRIDVPWTPPNFSWNDESSSAKTRRKNDSGKLNMCDRFLTGGAAMEVSEGDDVFVRGGCDPTASDGLICLGVAVDVSETQVLVR